jgi:UDP-N-acetylglucosamine acyltransferase
MIHPSSIISPSAEIGRNVEIGPFCVIEDGVHIGDGCRLEGHVSIKNGAFAGCGNEFGNGTVIGGKPQHTAIKSNFGKVIIGENNTFRENCTVHCSIRESEFTTIGNNNYLMVNSHIAHDCTVGNDNVLVNNVMLGGHVQVGNRVNFGGATGVHQFCRVGSFAMVGAQAHVIQDVPPFVTVDGLSSRIVGLNQIGLRRSGRTTEEINTLKDIYRLVYRSSLTWKDILQRLQEDYAVGAGAEMVQFLLTTKRGIVSERRSMNMPLRLVEDEDSQNNEEESRTIRMSVG